MIYVYFLVGDAYLHLHPTIRIQLDPSILALLWPVAMPCVFIVSNSAGISQYFCLISNID